MQTKGVEAQVEGGTTTKYNMQHNQEDREMPEMLNDDIRGITTPSVVKWSNEDIFHHKLFE